MSAKTRADLARLIAGIRADLFRLQKQVEVCSFHDDVDCGEDADWPKEYPFVGSMPALSIRLEEAVQALKEAVEATKKQYRMDVLNWLLAETKAQS